MSGPADMGIEVNGIRFNALGWFPLPGRGVMLTAQLVDGEYTHDQLTEALVGRMIQWHTILGVEMFAVDQQTDKKIGILI